MEVFMQFSAVGGVILALTLNILLFMWKEARDVKSAFATMFITAFAVLMMGDLVVGPLAGATYATDPDGAKGFAPWFEALGTAVVLLVIFPVFTLVTHRVPFETTPWGKRLTGWLVRKFGPSSAAIIALLLEGLGFFLYLLIFAYIFARVRKGLPPLWPPS